MKKRFLIALLLVCSLFLVACGKDEEEKSSNKPKNTESSARVVLEKFLAAYKKGDGKTACELMIPIPLIEDVDEDFDCAEEFSLGTEELEKVDFEILEEREMSDEDFERLLDSAYDNTRLDPKKISKVMIFYVKMTVDGMTENEEIYVINYNNEWLVIPS